MIANQVVSGLIPFPQLTQGRRLLRLMKASDFPHCGLRAADADRIGSVNSEIPWSLLSAPQLHNDRQRKAATKPLGYQLGRHRGAIKSSTLMPERAEQRAIKAMRKMRAAAALRKALRDAIRSKGLAISRETVKIFWRAAPREARH